MGGGFIMAGQLLLSLTILVTLHEFGHFITAKWFKMRVEKFYLFFDFLFPLANVAKFSLFKKKVGDTEYGIGWFPLGGYVNISGMIDETTEKGQLPAEPQPWEFRSKPAWQRLIVILGGVIVNLILGVIIFSSMAYVYGETKIPMSEVNKQGIHAGSYGKELGFMDGDKIVSVNGHLPEYFYDVLSTKELLADNPYFEVERNGEVKRIEMTADFTSRYASEKEEFIAPLVFIYVEKLTESLTNAKNAGLKVGDRIIGTDSVPLIYFHEFTAFMKEHKSRDVAFKVIRDSKDTLMLTIPVNDNGQIGFQEDFFRTFKVDTISYSFAQSIPQGIKLGYSTIRDQFTGLKKIFTGKIAAKDALSGPIGIARIFGSEWDWYSFWRLTGIISLVLAIMNLLPIPGLDGGYAIFILWELVTGKKVSDNVMQKALSVGLVIILLLTFFALGNDIRNLFK
jgi:regulator of sigma E protease